MEITFCKIGDMKYISHLDLIRLFQRAARRASLPVTITKGFSPRLKISISRALKLGLESERETAHFFLDRYMEPSDLVNGMNEQLPEGVKILNAEIDKEDNYKRRHI